MNKDKYPKFTDKEAEAFNKLLDTDAGRQLIKDFEEIYRDADTPEIMNANNNV